MDLATIRKLVITALFSDDQLLNDLVLKGGNAISLVYGFSSRESVDVDISMEKDFLDSAEAGRRILAALRTRFTEAGLVVFDEVFERRPPLEVEQDPKWGGYEARFKLTDRKASSTGQKNPDRLSSSAMVVGPLQQRVFRIQFSKYEYCAPKIAQELDNYTIYVYTPEMLVIEKLRAICQQMNEYKLRAHPTPRARDFYDIHCITTKVSPNLSTVENRDLAVLIFSAKHVPLRLLGLIRNYREFHRPDWPSVVLSAGEKIEPFDYYFDFALRQVEQLKPLWEEDSPG